MSVPDRFIKSSGEMKLDKAIDNKDFVLARRKLEQYIPTLKQGYCRKETRITISVDGRELRWQTVDERI